MSNLPIALLIAVPLVSALVASCLTPLMRRLAGQWGLLDQPDCHRKLQARAVPLGGGAVILAATLISVVVGLVLPHPWQSALWHAGWHLFALLVACLFVCTLGLIDDRVRLRGRTKMLGQLPAALVMVLAGLEIQQVQIVDWQLELGVLSIPLTLFWILGGINALNLLDGSDGVAATAGIVISLALAVMALMLPDRQVEAIVALALAGALAGFLLFNFPPASIYLGDAGSMFIGLVIGVLALRSGSKSPVTVAVAAPMALLAIPIFDTSMAIVRRKLTGRSLYTADRGHLHHCLQRRGLSSRHTVMAVGGLCAMTAAGALASSYWHNELLAIIAVLAVLGTLIASRCFGHAESLILTRRLARMLARLFYQPAGGTGRVREEKIHLEGSRQWDALWGTVVELAERFDVDSVRLNVSIPSLQEEFHALRESNAGEQPARQWHLAVPLIIHQQCAGRLHLRGNHRDVPSPRLLAELFPQLEELLSSIVRGDSAPRMHMAPENPPIQQPATCPIHAVALSQPPALAAHTTNS